MRAKYLRNCKVIIVTAIDGNSIQVTSQRVAFLHPARPTHGVRVLPASISVGTRVSLAFSFQSQLALFYLALQSGSRLTFETYSCLRNGPC